MDNRLFFSATQRNKKFIRDVISSLNQTRGSILEIGSGSGEHGVFFQKCFPDIIWQTSDPNLLHRKSITSWIDYEKINKNMPKPLSIDVEIIPWNIPPEIIVSLQGIVSINMIHVATWNCTKSLFKESGKLLKKGKFLMLYGPFKISNNHTSQSNKIFDKSLRIENNSWGIRNLEEVSNEGEKNGFFQENIINMPANNLCIIYRKVSLEE